MSQLDHPPERRRSEESSPNSILASMKEELRAQAIAEIEASLGLIMTEVKVELEQAFAKYQEGLRAIDQEEIMNEITREQVDFMRGVARQNLEDKISEIKKRVREKLLK